MALSDKTVIDKIEILENGVIQVRRARRFFDDTDMVAERYARTVLEPGQDVLNQPLRLQAICNVVWTPAVIAAYRASKAAPLAGLPQPQLP